MLLHTLVSWIVIVSVCGSSVDKILTPQGCEEGWTHFNNQCYEFNAHAVHFVTAKDICNTKDSTLASVWTTTEADHIISTMWHDIEKSHHAWIGVVTDPSTADKRSRLSWLDGSYFDAQGKDIPADSVKEMCGTITGSGEQMFQDCEERMSAFICKKPLKMAYVVTEIFNSTYAATFQSEDPEKLLFERVWPPKLQEVPRYLNKIGTTQVSQETDCAYRCFKIDNCRGFTLTCLSSWKCNQYTCDLYEPSIQ